MLEVETTVPVREIARLRHWQDSTHGLRLLREIPTVVQVQANVVERRHQNRKRRA